MSDYKNLLNPLLHEVEGSRSETYLDHKGIPTAGHGFNLNDEENQGIMRLHGIDPEEVKAGRRSLASEESDKIRDAILNRKERLVKAKVGDEYFDQLTPNKKATLMSLGYQSLNNLGPNLRQRMADGDDIGAMRELILNTNADEDPGILKRRLKEAELYGGPVDFSQTFQTMNSAEKEKLRNIIAKVQNEHTKKELMDKYGSYLGAGVDPVQFPKLNRLLTYNGK